MSGNDYGLNEYLDQCADADDIAEKYHESDELDENLARWRETADDPSTKAYYQSLDYRDDLEAFSEALHETRKYDYEPDQGW